MGRMGWGERTDRLAERESEIVNVDETSDSIPFSRSKIDGPTDKVQRAPRIARGRLRSTKCGSCLGSVFW